MYFSTQRKVDFVSVGGDTILKYFAGSSFYKTSLVNDSVNFCCEWGGGWCFTVLNIKQILHLYLQVVRQSHMTLHYPVIVIVVVIVIVILIDKVIAIFFAIFPILQPFPFMYSLFQSLLAICCNFEIFRAILRHFQPFPPLSKHSLFRTDYTYFQPYPDISRYFKTFPDN